MASGYDEFIAFRDQKFLDKDDLKYATSYICAQLNSPGTYYQYYYDMYSYTSKYYIVLKNSGRTKTRLGEAFCEGQVVNFLKDEKHKKCSFASVYFNAVF